MKQILSAIAALTVCLPTGAMAADLCTATVIRPIPASDESYAAKAGTKLGAVTQFIIGSKRAVFCSHGGGCYVAYTTVNGKKVPNVRLDNCRVDFSSGEDYIDDEKVYYLVVVRNRNSASSLTEDDIENRLLELGLCNACAGTAAFAYVTRPSSPCGQLTRSALEGNPVARRKLTSGDENACTAEWHK